MPFPPLSFSDAKWFVSTFFRIFENPVGLYLPGIAALTFLVGCISILLENKRTFFIIALPILFTLLASGFHKYPFKGRLLLFIVPSLLLFIAEGAQQIRDRTRHNWAIIGIALIGLLFFQPLLSVSYHLIKPRTSVGGYEIVEEIKPVIGYVREHQQDGDILYLHPGAWAAFKYYQQRYGYEDSGYIVGVSSQDNWSDYASDLDQLRGNERVWILFSHFQSRTARAKEKFFLYHLDGIGTRLDSFKSIGATVYLYDLSEEASKTGK